MLSLENLKLSPLDLTKLEATDEFIKLKRKFKYACNFLRCKCSVHYLYT